MVQILRATRDELGAPRPLRLAFDWNLPAGRMHGELHGPCMCTVAKFQSATHRVVELYYTLWSCGRALLHSMELWLLFARPVFGSRDPATPTLWRRYVC